MQTSIKPFKIRQKITEHYPIKQVKSKRKREHSGNTKKMQMETSRNRTDKTKTLKKNFLIKIAHKKEFN